MSVRPCVMLWRHARCYELAPKHSKPRECCQNRPARAPNGVGSSWTLGPQIPGIPSAESLRCPAQPPCVEGFPAVVGNDRKLLPRALRNGRCDFILIQQYCLLAYKMLTTKWHFKATLGKIGNTNASPVSLFKLAGGETQLGRGQGYVSRRRAIPRPGQERQVACS